MSFKAGDSVIHKSDMKPRKMVVVDIAKKNLLNNKTIHDELVNTGRVVDGSYYCTWISGNKKGEGYFLEEELELQ